MVQQTHNSCVTQNITGTVLSQIAHLSPEKFSTAVTKNNYRGTENHQNSGPSPNLVATSLRIREPRELINPTITDVLVVTFCIRICQKPKCPFFFLLHKSEHRENRNKRKTQKYFKKPKNSYFLRPKRLFEFSTKDFIYFNCLAFLFLERGGQKRLGEKLCALAENERIILVGTKRGKESRVNWC